MLTGLRQLVERGLERRGVVRDRPLTDPFDYPIGHYLARIPLDIAVVHRRRSRGGHQDRAWHHLSCAWIAVRATVLTMSSTGAPRDRSLTGLFRPCSTGPIAIAPALRCTALYVLLPVLRSGKISTVARPATFEPGILVAATDGSTAAS